MSNYEDLVTDLCDALVSGFHSRLWQPRYVQLREMTSPSHKLIYLYLVLSGPQSFTGIRRALGLSSRTVDRGLKMLLVEGYVVLDEVYLYSVMD